MIQVCQYTVETYRKEKLSLLRSLGRVPNKVTFEMGHEMWVELTWLEGKEKGFELAKCITSTTWNEVIIIHRKWPSEASYDLHLNCQKLGTTCLRLVIWTRHMHFQSASPIMLLCLYCCVPPHSYSFSHCCCPFPLRPSGNPSLEKTNYPMPSSFSLYTTFPKAY